MRSLSDLPAVSAVNSLGGKQEEVEVLGTAGIPGNTPRGQRALYSLRLFAASVKRHTDGLLAKLWSYVSSKALHPSLVHYHTLATLLQGTRRCNRLPAKDQSSLPGTCSPTLTQPTCKRHMHDAATAISSQPGPSWQAVRPTTSAKPCRTHDLGLRNLVGPGNYDE